MSKFRDTNLDCRKRWETNADFWNQKMGIESNFFHRHIVRPKTEELLDIKKDDLVLDIACGNGNFSKRLYDLGAEVVAFDFSEKLINHAKQHYREFLNKIEFNVCDATNYIEVMNFKKSILFDKAVSNMAIMDISDIEPLFQAVFELLKEHGIFVFSTHHPCFQRPVDKYLTPCIHQGEAIVGQPIMQLYYHRSLQDILNIAFKYGFHMDGFYEEKDDDSEYPIIIIVRLKKGK